MKRRRRMEATNFPNLFTILPNLGILSLNVTCHAIMAIFTNIKNKVAAAFFVNFSGVIEYLLEHLVATV
ncbi:hypothetical protein JHK82_021182 [Glycine max]|uniref:Uncharacterized protein n=2 Tax=Glycine subgen. Soja TaxID=1462606 RepID=K7L690_SOYBN|nr:hypothetical protein JHK87_021087 [Glycine soja]KAG5015500.1 hypothetical protein JHK85_021636 [Glycine max]KAG5025276.1 hypothetical protein JHK86_021190 [Glycine max]KAG5136451.1 hypothetical protein JHK82_021182 [Glycine max]KAH1050899.1 hypothetical protein GYH30_021039 [Glycine max]